MVVSFSVELQDAFTPLSNTVATNLQFIGEVRDFYAERVKLEREYARGLQKLAVAARQKAPTYTTLLVAGEAPSKAVTDGSTREQTLCTAWQTILSQADEEAYTRNNFAESLDIDIVGGLKNLGKRMETLRCKHHDFANNLLKERDNAYALKAKAKERYDACCKDVENNRVKQTNVKKAEKAEAMQHALMTEMYNAKNVYLLAIEVANRMKDKYFEKDLPSVHDDLQALWTTIINRFSMIMSNQTDKTKKQYEVLSRYNDTCAKAISNIDPGRDQDVYADYNKRPFFPPQEFTFEPCQIFYDNDQMNLDPEPKVFLQNKLLQNQHALSEVTPKVEGTRRDVLKMAELRKAYTENPALGDLDTVTEQYFEAIRQAVSLETERDTLEAEVELLKDTLGGDTGSGQSHNFKQSAFPVAKHCYVCGGKIWGVSKVGLACRDCGISLHNQCQLKCPADCGEPTLALTRAESKASYAARPGAGRSRTSSIQSAGSGDSGNRRVSMLSHGSSLSVNNASNGKGGKQAKAVYDYSATGANQLSLVRGEPLDVVADDSGNGWTKVSNSQGNTGIVPTSYIKIDASLAPLTRQATTSSAHSSPFGGDGGGEYGTVKAIYPYTAGSPRELSIAKGDVLELTAKGSSIAAGWTEVIFNGKKGIVPTSYVK